MKPKMPGYRLIDQSTWPRREHFSYYRTRLKCGYSLTGRVDVTELVQCAQERGLRKYGCFLYVISKTVNEMESMKMMVTAEGAPGIWDEVHPNFTVFHQDDETFSDLWTEYDPEFEGFYRGFEKTLEQYGSCHGVKGRPEQPANFFCTSCVPWMDYTGYATHSQGEPAMFPIVTFGKYTWQDGRCGMPVTVTISHAAADGYHTSMFFQKLQKNVEQFPEYAGQK